MNLLKALAAALFIATSALAANAQERYEQMTILYVTSTRQMSISTDAGEYKEEAAPKSAAKDTSWDLSPALVRCKLLSEQGWELYHIAPVSSSVYFIHMRRKVN